MVLLEVETKVRIDSDNVNELRKKIIRIANFVEKETRKDDYFAIKRIIKQGYPKKAFRIRSNEDEYVINFKKWLTKYWDKEIVVKEEFEFKIKDPKPFLALMQDLGFVQWMTKIKSSESYKHKKDKRIIIEINKVKHLGYFMEIEYLCPMWEMKKAKDKIRRVLEELEIRPNQINNTGYTKMLWKKGIKDKRYFIR